MKQPNVTVYGSSSCRDTMRTRAFLDSQNIPYEYKDVADDPAYTDYITELNGGKCVMPTLRIDNQTFVNPSDDDLRKAMENAVQTLS